VTFVIADGRSNWLKGLVLTLAYFILGASYFYHAEPPQYGLSVGRCTLNQVYP
jgi:hypothetical protein